MLFLEGLFPLPTPILSMIKYIPKQLLAADSFQTNKLFF